MRTLWPTSRWCALTFGPILGLACLSASAEAQVIKGCVNKSSGALRIISGSGACAGDETGLQWGLSGPKGDKGDKGIKGDKGDKGDKGETGDDGGDGDKGDPGPRGPAGPPGPAGTANGSGSSGNFNLPYKGGAQADGAVFDVVNLTNSNRGAVGSKGFGIEGQSSNGSGVGAVTNFKDGYGVFATGNNGATAVKGVSNGGGRGVVGESDTKGGVVGISKSGNGVTGQTDSQTAGAVVGIGHRAGLFQGNVGVVGQVAITGGQLTVDGPIAAKVVTSANKMFRIDHPIDPTNKSLAHSSVESSEMMNIYSGGVVLDDKGEATIELAGWFEALNKNVRYQLTPIAAPAPNLYIAEKVRGNRFKIAGGLPRMEVSWQVTGVRQDAWAKAHPLQVEQEKTGTERGTYLYPEVFSALLEESLLLAEDTELLRDTKKLSIHEESGVIKRGRPALESQPR